MSLAFPKKFNSNLEILRGFAALMVVINHIIFFNNYFDSGYHISQLNGFAPPSHFAVLIFFVLSGYVIGLNHKERLFGENALIYLKKRFIRIYPIYFLAILFGLLVTTYHNSIGVILANFTLTQNIVYPSVWENPSAWSLNFEVLFYLLFIPLSFFNVKSGIALGAFFLLGILTTYFPVPRLISAYSFGFCYWLLGLYIARNTTANTHELKIIPLLFYILAVGNLLDDHSYIVKLFSLVKTPPPIVVKFWSQSAVQLEDLIFIPYCFMMVLFFAGRDFKYKKQVFILLQFFILFIVYYWLKRPHPHSFFTSVSYLALAAISYFIPIRESFLKKVGTELGGVSYALYIIHFPMLILFGRIIIPGDNLFLYLIRVILYFAATIFASWLLEKKLQPVFKKWFFKPKTLVRA